MVAVADTSPLNYLILVEHVELLPELFGRVIIPVAVWRELNDSEAPEQVRRWVRSKRSWIDLRSAGSIDRGLDHLDSGEQEAIAVAEQLAGSVVLLDETDARREAMLRKIPTMGTLGILREGARRNQLDLFAALAALKRTSFFVSERLIQTLLEEEIERRRQCSS